MKKITVLALLVILAVFSAGCGTTASSSGGGGTSIPASTVANSVGALATATADPTLYASTYLGVSTLGKVIPSSVSMPTLESDGWFWYRYAASSSGDGYDYSYDWDMRVKLWGKTLGLIDTLAEYLMVRSGAEQLDKMYTFMVNATSFTSSDGSVSGYTVKLGNSKDDPYKLENMHASTPSVVDGPVSYTGSYAGTTYSVSMTYGSLSWTYPYPTGTVSFSVSSGSSVAYSGTITYNGTSTATITFSSGETYMVNLITGVATPV